MNLWVSNLGKAQWNYFSLVCMVSAGLIHISTATCQVKWNWTVPDVLTYVTGGLLEGERKLGNISVIIQLKLLHMVSGFKKQYRNAKLQGTNTLLSCLRSTSAVHPQIPRCGEMRHHLLLGRMTMSYSKGCAYKVGEFVALKICHRVKF